MSKCVKGIHKYPVNIIKWCFIDWLITPGDIELHLVSNWQSGNSSCFNYSLAVTVYITHVLGDPIASVRRAIGDITASLGEVLLMSELAWGRCC